MHLYYSSSKYSVADTAHDYSYHPFIDVSTKIEKARTITELDYMHPILEMEQEENHFHLSN